ncbi:TRAP transporter substrate-binding protein [Paenibacillus alkalitolerans]|uniref:TRAP transporter substrate-binding protein n=1 Tax=Paenibacillus alkalitolerans TaxID=2799335 RepID=UPI0018F6B5EC|nr:TRAP transporter substrate-binding protein [Paenibacillus alkalitolerans]
MKPIYGTFLIILFGLVTAVLIGFRPGLSESLPVDHEQTGLRDRIIIKFSHVVAENTPKGLAAEHFARLVKQKTNDRVEIQVFPNGMLYSENTEAEALKRGDIQMIAPSFSNMSNIDPAWLVMDLPFAFRDQAAVDEALNGTVGEALFQTVEEQNMHGVAFWKNGFKQMTSNRNPLVVPEDFRGQTFRILPSKVLASQFSALGAKTVNIPFNEVYRSLQNGIVDGQENTISNIYTKRLYLVQKYMTISNHGYLGYAVIVNKPFWERMPDDLRSAVQAAMVETTAWINRETIAMNERQLRQIRESGAIEIRELTDEERKRWAEAVQPIYKRYRDVVGGGLVDQVIKMQHQ